MYPIDCAVEVLPVLSVSMKNIVFMSMPWFAVTFEFIVNEFDVTLDELAVIVGATAKDTT